MGEKSRGWGDPTLPSLKELGLLHSRLQRPNTLFEKMRLFLGFLPLEEVAPEHLAACHHSGLPHPHIPSPQGVVTPSLSQSSGGWGRDPSRRVPPPWPAHSLQPAAVGISGALNGPGNSTPAGSQEANSFVSSGTGL